MAELVGLVASVIQVAGAGLKISKELYQYADSVATADRRVKDIAKEVEITSFVIKELGNVFGQDETSAVISADAIKTATDAMKECSEIFAEIKTTLNKSKNSRMGRLMLPFRDNRIELLRSHIDKLKAALQLLMSVLTFAHQVASRKLDRAAEAKHREEIKQLVQEKKRSTTKYEESLRNLSISDSSTQVDDETDAEDVEKTESNRNSDHRANSIPTPTPQLPIQVRSIPSTITSEALSNCVVHVRQLLDHLEILQQALTGQRSGDDHAEHHQNLVGSYLNTRNHLDGVLGGNESNRRPERHNYTSPLPDARLHVPTERASETRLEAISFGFDPVSTKLIPAERYDSHVGRQKGRKRSLTAEQRSEAALTRIVGACSNCRRRKEKCDSGTPCRSCVQHYGYDLISHPCRKESHLQRVEQDSQSQGDFGQVPVFDPSKHLKRSRPECPVKEGDDAGTLAPLTTAEAIPFGDSDEMSFDLGLGFRDSTGALENFDFDSFLHVGEDNKMDTLDIGFDAQGDSPRPESTDSHHPWTQQATSTSGMPSQHDNESSSTPSVPSTVQPLRHRKKQEKMSLGDFLSDQSLGTWADEMEDMLKPRPTQQGVTRPFREPPSSINHALQDYQQQLRMLESRNESGFSVPFTNTTDAPRIDGSRSKISDRRGNEHRPSGQEMSLSYTFDEDSDDSTSTRIYHRAETQPRRSELRQPIPSMKSEYLADGENLPMEMSIGYALGEARQDEMEKEGEEARGYTRQEEEEGEEDDDEVDALLREWTTILG